MQTPLESFIDHKAETGMQCGNYSIDLPELQDKEQYRFHFDATACVGCRCCEVACNEQNNNPADIKWRRVGEMEAGVFPNVLQMFNSMSCNHCVDPACLIGCPTESYIKIDETGIVVHDDDTCIGCQYCTWNCPYGVPTYHEERNIVTKCHMCHERLDVGESPACVQACPAGAIMIEAVNVDAWLAGDIDEQGNMPHLVDARVTNSTTRYTMSDAQRVEMENMQKADEHILKPFHAEIPLVFMTTLTQISLGAFIALFLGDLFSLFGLSEPSVMMAFLVMIPAALGLPLSALHLGRPILALTAMKNWKNSWLSREAIALGAFTGMMSINVLLYYLEVSQFLRIIFEVLTLGMGLFGIYAQAMIYRIKARPSWNRRTTNMKFFGVAYVGLLMMALASASAGINEAVSPLLSVALLSAMAQAFFSYEDFRTLENAKEDDYELGKTKRLYARFSKVHYLRKGSFVIGAIVLPLLVSVLFSAGLISSALLFLSAAVLLSFISELSDRYLFYVTSVPLSMAGGFFVGNQR